MVARPRPENWRGIAWMRGWNRTQSDTAVRWALTRAVTDEATAVPRRWWVRFVTVLPGVSPRSTTVLDRLTPGGMLMIFRKENRGESFQRQIANLRQQLQPEDERESSDYEFDERQDTSQFAASPTRGETYAPPRTTDLLGTSAATAAAPPATAPGAQRGSWQTADANTSVIATNAHWNGTLRSDGSLHVHGRADGELHAANDLYVAEGAEVDAEVFADNVVVAGVVRGRIDARTRLEVLPQGHVAGDVRAPKLVVHEGARLTGQLKMESTGEGGASPYSTSAPAAKPRRSNS